MNQGLGREVLDREASGREALGQGASGRVASGREASGRVASGREALGQGASVREALGLEASVQDLVEEQRHHVFLQLQMRDSHTWLGKISVIFYRFYSVPILCTGGTIPFCLLVCCIYPNFLFSRNTFWGNPRPFLLR